MKKKGLIIILCLIVAVTAYALWSNSIKRVYHSSLTIETKKGKSGLSDYTLLYKNSSKIEFTLDRPSKSDTSVLLCIPAAFTSLDKLQVDGVYIWNGKKVNHVNHSLGGAMELIDGNCRILSTNSGKLLTDSLLKLVEGKNGSLFQQICMIDSGKVPSFKENSPTYRRGIAIFKDGKIAVIESKSPVSLETFASDIASFGAMELLYTDMGSWDEGWYRNPDDGRIVIIGHDLSQTAKQSNWVVFRR
jgi:hypothetical protein